MFHLPYEYLCTLGDSDQVMDGKIIIVMGHVFFRASILLDFSLPQNHIR